MENEVRREFFVKGKSLWRRWIPAGRRSGGAGEPRTKI